MLRRAFLLVALLMFTYVAANAQSNSNFGREFYVAFAQNQGGSESSNFMGLFITSRVKANGHVDIPLLNFSQDFITLPGLVSVIPLPSDVAGSTVEMLVSGAVYSGGGVHVTADQDIAVFGMNHKEWSSDAFMALPVGSIGKTYRSINFPSSAFIGSETAGEFWMVGTENNTTVSITPNAATAGGSPAHKLFQVQLNKGDAYMIQGNKFDSLNDMTGSLITSDKPLAFFSGHQRTQIPADAVDSDGAVSRDHLCEQIPDESAWGDSVIVIPFKSSAKPDLVRIVAAVDGTEIRVNGVVQSTIGAGGFYQITAIAGPTLISSNHPILVGQYMHTSWGDLNDPSHPAYGDPALALVLPVEQFSTDYTVIADQNSAFTGNFVNIVAAAGELPALIYLDSVLIPSSSFQSIPNSVYKYAQIAIQQGTHHLTSAQRFGLTVYALGPVDSYAYTGGALVTPLNSLAVTSAASSHVPDLYNVQAANNPFGSRTLVSYALSSPQGVRLELTDEAGRVRLFEMHGRLEAGAHALAIDGTDLAAGCYFLRITTSTGASDVLKLVKSY